MSDRSYDEEQFENGKPKLNNDAQSEKCLLNTVIGPVMEGPGVVQRFHVLIANLLKDYFKRVD